MKYEPYGGSIDQYITSIKSDIQMANTPGYTYKRFWEVMQKKRVNALTAKHQVQVLETMKYIDPTNQWITDRVSEICGENGDSKFLGLLNVLYSYKYRLSRIWINDTGVAIYSVYPSIKEEDVSNLRGLIDPNGVLRLSLLLNHHWKNQMYNEIFAPLLTVQYRGEWPSVSNTRLNIMLYK
jgi:hypothetical protein